MRVGAILAAALLLLGSGATACASTVGVRELEIASPERKAAVQAVVWYPAGDNGRSVLIGENAVFRGTPGYQDAPIAKGRFPLVLISQGGFRAARNVASWLAAALATDGFIAAVASPPPVPQGKAMQSALDELWLQPADLSATLTAVERDPVLAGQIAGSKIGAVGFFLGADAVLELAGARIDAAAFGNACEGAALRRDCTWSTQRHVDLHRTDAGRPERLNVDRRIRAAVAIDPELAGALTGKSLRAITIPVHIVSLGRRKAAPGALSGSRLAAKIPRSHYAAIPGATASSSFAECKPQGRAMLRNEGGEVSLCDDGAGRTRAQTHAALAALVEASLRHSFSIGR